MMDNTLEAMKSIAAPSKYPNSIFKDNMKLKGISFCIMVCLNDYGSVYNNLTNLYVDDDKRK
jgi:hypothetical protein